MKTLIVFLLAFLLFDCGGAEKSPTGSFKANKAELGEDWEQFKHDASFNVWNFEGARPAEHRTPQGARVFWNGEVSAEELNLVDAGLSEMLAACRRDTNRWNPADIWTKFVYFQTIPEYKIIFVQSNYTLQEGEARGCAGMITGPHGVFTAAGTVGGLNDRVNASTPGSKGGIYIVVPKQSADQLARAECKMLLKTAIKNEGMHVWFTNSPELYFAHANDADTPDHNYCGN